MTSRALQAFSRRSNAAELSTSETPAITIIHETKASLFTDLDLQALGLSAALSRKVAAAAGGRLVGKRIVGAMDDLHAYLRAHGTPEASPPPAPKAPKVRLVATKSRVPTTEEIARANGLIVKGEQK